MQRYVGWSIYALHHRSRTLVNRHVRSLRRRCRVTDVKSKVKLILHCINTQHWKAYWAAQNLRLAACGSRVGHNWCSDILQWQRDHGLEFPGLTDLARNAFCVMATSAAYERMFSIYDNVVNSRRANLKGSSVNDILFVNSALRIKRWSLIRFQIFAFCWLWNEPLNKLPPAMKRIPRVFSGF